jgi:hypothetical protein
MPNLNLQFQDFMNRSLIIQFLHQRNQITLSLGGYASETSSCPRWASLPFSSPGPLPRFATSLAFDLPPLCTAVRRPSTFLPDVRYEQYRYWYNAKLLSPQEQNSSLARLSWSDGNGRAGETASIIPKSGLHTLH